tara:strand:+ start:1065 stop:1286 length:222 start_codon:yes stop_codon:yes gene_type:complete
MPSFRTKTASQSHLDLREAKRSCCIPNHQDTWWFKDKPWKKPKAWRGSKLAKRLSAKAERKQAKLNLNRKDTK